MQLHNAAPAQLTEQPWLGQHQVQVGFVGEDVEQLHQAGMVQLPQQLDLSQGSHVDALQAMSGLWLGSSLRCCKAYMLLKQGMHACGQFIDMHGTFEHRQAICTHLLGLLKVDFLDSHHNSQLQTMQPIQGSGRLLVLPPQAGAEHSWCWCYPSQAACKGGFTKKLCQLHLTSLLVYWWTLPKVPCPSKAPLI